MDISRQRVSQVQKKIKKGTLNPLVKKAKKAVDAILQGKSVGDVKDVRAADVLSAAKMVLDRSDPIVQKMEQSHLHVNVEIKDEDRDRYRKALGLGVIEGEFERVPEVRQICASDSSSQSDSSCSPSALDTQVELSNPELETLKSVTSQPVSPIPQMGGMSLESKEIPLGESGRLANE